MQHLADTIVVGERVWFCRHDGTHLEWALLLPWHDGSASLRTAGDLLAFPSPDGVRGALKVVEDEGYLLRQEAIALRWFTEDVEMPLW